MLNAFREKTEKATNVDIPADATYQEILSTKENRVLPREAQQRTITAGPVDRWWGRLKNKWTNTDISVAQRELYKYVRASTLATDDLIDMLAKSDFDIVAIQQKIAEISQNFQQMGPPMKSLGLEDQITRRRDNDKMRTTVKDRVLRTEFMRSNRNLGK